jgi:rhomboid protease GluP
MGLFVFGLLIPGINNWGHGGGILGGIGIAFLLGYNENVKERLSHKYWAVVLLVITVGTLLWAIITGVYYRFLI